MVANFLVVVYLVLNFDKIIYFNLFFKVAILEVGAAGGATFSNMDSGAYPVSIPIIMMAVDIVIYAILTLYFDNVVPGLHWKLLK